MQGPEVRDGTVPQFIDDFTTRVWRDHDIAALDTYYNDDIILRTPAGLITGRAAGKSAALSMVANFPDRQLLDQDLIWCGDDRGGFLASSRVLNVAGHGAASAGFLSITDSHCDDGQIQEEWCVQDSAAIAQSRGQTAAQAAADLIAAGDTAPPLTPEIDVKTRYKGFGNDDIWGDAHAEILHRIMQGDMAVIAEQYDRACQLNYAGGVTANGTDAADEFWLGLRSALPNARFKIAHQIGRADKNMPPRSAIRWSMVGLHEGWGRFGQPTGAPLFVMGISHVDFGPRGLRRETTLIDDISIWKQIYLQKGAS